MRRRRYSVYSRVPMLAIVAIFVLVAAGCGGGGTSSSTDTDVSTEDASATPGANAGLKTPIPISPGGELVESDLDARGLGTPGRGPFTGDRLLIPAIGVNAAFSTKAVPGSGPSRGVMPNPNGPEDVAYYDFSAFDQLGGLPGRGGNVVLAGHVDYINYGPAVFWRLHELKTGDRVNVRLADGSTVAYEVVFNKQVGVEAPNADRLFGKLVQATSPESITLITCSGDFANGHYNNRQIVWARRV